MRIVQFVANLDMGGLERLAVDLANCQLHEGHTPFIYSLTHPGRFAAEARALGIQVRSFSKGAGPQLGTVCRIVRQLRIDHPDVLHGHNHLVHHYAVLAGRLARVPVIVNTRHGSPFRFTSGPHGSQTTTDSPDSKADTIYRATMPWTDAVVFISEATRRFFVDHRRIPESKTRVILNGARLEKFLDAPADPGRRLPSVTFGIASRLVAEKDYFTLLRAFRIVADQLPESELRIAGDGPLRDAVMQYCAQLNLGSRVIFLGSVSDTPRFYAGLDIFVLSSLNEGLPLVVLEAMAAGLPVVSTRAGGIGEVVIDGQTGYLSNPGDAAGLAQAMIRMARQPELAVMGALGRKAVADRFRIETTWRQYYELFMSLGAKA